MKTIWKYTLDITDEQTVLMPQDAFVLSVGWQNEQLVLWALLDPDSVKLSRTFLIAGTGHPLPADRTRYLGTVQEPDRPLVWHVFEGR